MLTRFPIVININVPVLPSTIYSGYYSFPPGYEPIGDTIPYFVTGQLYLFSVEDCSWTGVRIAVGSMYSYDGVEDLPPALTRTYQVNHPSGLDYDEITVTLVRDGNDFTLTIENAGSFYTPFEHYSPSIPVELLDPNVFLFGMVGDVGSPWVLDCCTPTATVSMTHPTETVAVAEPDANAVVWFNPYTGAHTVVGLNYYFFPATQNYDTVNDANRTNCRGIILRANNGVWRVIEADTLNKILTLRPYVRPNLVIHETSS